MTAHITAPTPDKQVPGFRMVITVPEGLLIKSGGFHMHLSPGSTIYADEAHAGPDGTLSVRLGCNEALARFTVDAHGLTPATDPVAKVWAMAEKEWRRRGAWRAALVGVLAELTDFEAAEIRAGLQGKRKV